MPEHPFSKYLPDADPATFPSVHPHAEIFPMISVEEMEALAKDITANGLKHPITVVVLADPIKGQEITWILDGRNRWVACTMAGIRPVLKDETLPLTKLVQSKKISATLDLVITENFARRHLNPTERTFLAKRLATAKGGGKQDGDVTVAEAAKRIRISAANIGRLRHLEKAAPTFYAALQRGEYKNMNVAYQAAGLNQKPPVKIYVREYVPTGSLKIHRGSGSSRESRKSIIWTQFPTMAEAEEFVRVRRAELQAEAHAIEENKNAEARDREQFSEEQYETMVDLGTLDQQQLIELSYRVDFPKKALLPDSSESTFDLLERVRKASADNPGDLLPTRMLQICDEIKILLEHPRLVHPLDDRLVYWLKLMGVKFCDLLLRDRKAWLKSMLDPTPSRHDGWKSSTLRHEERLRPSAIEECLQ